MNAELATLAVMTLNTWLQNSARLSAQMQDGSLTFDSLAELQRADDAARSEQVAAIERAKAEGR